MREEGVLEMVEFKVYFEGRCSWSKMGEKEIKDNTKIFGRSYWKNELSLIKVGDVAEVADIKNNKRNSFRR